MKGYWLTVWKTEENYYGQFLINYNKEETECTVTLPKGNFVLITLDGEKTTLSVGKQRLLVPPLSAILMENEESV